MKVVYYADDGTEFESEEACHKYERRLQVLIYEDQYNGFRAYDSNAEEINFNCYDLECLEDAFQDISYIIFNNANAIESFTEQSKCYGLCEIEDDIDRPLVVGERYFYDWDKDKWMCLEDKQKELDKIASVFREAQIS